VSGNPLPGRRTGSDADLEVRTGGAPDVDRRRPWPIWLSWLAALAPFATFGVGTFPLFAVAAVRLRSVGLGLSAVVYGASTVGMIAVAGVNDNLFGIFFGVSWLVGTGHALAIRPRLVRSRPESPTELLARLAAEERDASADDPVLRAILRRREQRRLAREIAAADPRLAAELGIGRPGEDDRFDDGGLIDVNVVDAAVLATLPGFDAPMAERVVQARQRLDGLRSAADLVVHADVPPEVVDQVADRLLFGGV
jgi:hypothetical protein